MCGKNKTTRGPRWGSALGVSTNRQYQTPPSVLVYILGFLTCLLHVIRSSQLQPALNPHSHGQASWPSALQTVDMDRRQSLAPTPVTSQTAPPEESRACRECQRRRVKCDGSMPECAMCQRYRRHCLYDKHSRTRLTRKYAGLRSCLEVPLILD
jgi:hypothetical protein